MVYKRELLSDLEGILVYDVRLLVKVDLRGAQVGLWGCFRCCVKGGKYFLKKFSLHDLLGSIYKWDGWGSKRKLILLKGGGF